MMSKKLLLLASVGLASLQHAAYATSWCSGTAVCDAHADQDGLGTIVVTKPDDAAGQDGAEGSFSATNSFAAQGHSGWANLPGSTVDNFPPHLLHHIYQTTIGFDPRLPAGATVQYRCPSVSLPGTTSDDCHVVVYFYECSPCVTEKGGISGVLASQGFERTRCAPTFNTGKSGNQHRMTGFVKTIAKGETETITLGGALDFAMFAMSAGNGVECSFLSGALECEAPGLWDWCLYKQGCQLTTCVNHGPSPGGCDVTKCPLDELI